AQAELDAFAEGPWGQRFPTVSAAWRNAWDRVIPFFAFPPAVREIQGFLQEQYGTEVSPEFISSVTDEVMAEVTAWQSRPLEPM
ncbi:transposase, partial [Paraburkholderia sp. NMBU_R16]|uniref:transposase n=1 Tax=Paraburkholderia sp. NMBU_R16 TaxID=2698676 RepID=UPI0020B748FD